MIQLVQPNLSITGQVGWCLQYARQVFGAPVVEAMAWTAWINTDFKHGTNEPMPDVSVPVWFDYYQNGIQYGHVAVYVPGKGFYSSPYKSTQTHAVLPSISEVERIYGCKYVGWSEDISNVRVAGGNMIPDADNYYWRYGQNLAMKLRGRELSRDEFRQHIVGKTDLQAIELLSDDPEAVVAQNWQNVGKIAVQDNWEKQINDGLAGITELTTRQAELGKVIENKDAEISRLNKEIESLKAQVGENSKWETFKALIRELIK